jgi:sialidase-1
VKQLRHTVLKIRIATQKFVLTGVLISLFALPFNSQSQTRPTQWHGFEKFAFSFNGHEAYIVKPEKASPGNPWIWRAYFPDWHFEMDSILVAKGFHIAFIDCSDMYGSPEAMQVWDKFYHHLTEKYSFSKKTVLEGVSRGGLYIYGWAKRNPEKVGFIYAEAPVLDIKSWPGGKGKGRRSADDWKKCLTAYSFNEEQALRYNDNPVDNIETLAAYKVPVVHVVCKSDSIVPVAENSDILAERYQKSGGMIRVDEMKENVRLEGHHFNITNPAYYADLIYKSVVPVNEILPSSSFFKLNNGLPNTFQKIYDNKELTVAFLGGSITYNKGWRDKICQHLQETYPKTTFRFIPAGVPSLGSLPHAFRLQTDVLGKGSIDLLFIEAAVNDRANRTDSVTQLRAMEGIIRHALTANPTMNIVLMAFADEYKNHDFERNKEPLEVKVHRQMAEYYGLPFLNLAEEVYKRIKHGEFSWTEDFKDLHPSPYGQNIYYQSIKTLLQLSEKECKGGIVKTILPEPLNESAYEKGIYVDIHQVTDLKGFTISENWEPTDQKETRAGYVHVPVLEAVNPGSSFTFSFTGNAVGIAIVSGPDAGIIEYRIDNRKTETLNLFTQWSNFLHLPWYLILADGLNEGKHILNVKTASDTENANRNACRIVHFLVN